MKFIEFNGDLYFSAKDTGIDRELFRLRADNNTIELVADIAAGAPGGDPGLFTIFNGELFFEAEVAGTGTDEEPFKYNPTTNSVTQITNGNPLAGEDSNLTGQFVFNSNLYATMESSVGRELFEYDPTTTTYNLHTNLNGTGDGYPLKFIEFNRDLYFSAKDTGIDRELFRLTSSPSVSLSRTPATASEDSTTNLVYTFTRTGDTTSALTVNFSVGGTAAFSSDYTQSGAASFSASSGTITIGIGASSATLTIDPTADSDVELDETVQLSLAAGTGYNIDTAGAITGTITNDDSASLSIDDVSLAEGNSGTISFDFTVTLNAAVDSAVAVNFAAADDTATTADSDYAANSGTLNFTGNAGETKNISIIVNGDTQVEVAETFLVNLSSIAAGGRDVTFADSQGQGSIQNDDTNVAIAATDADKAEGDTGNTAFTFTVTRNGVTSGTSSVEYAVTGSGTYPGDASDFGGSFPSGVVNFAASETNQMINIDVSGEMVAENDETFTVTLSNPSGATIGTTTAAGIIQNDDTAEITIAESGSSTNITEGGSTDSYDLVLTSQPTADVTVTVDPDGQTDLGNGAGSPINLTFTDGDWDSAQTVAVTAVDDQIAEGSHSSTITHSAASSDGFYDGISIIDVTAMITDNDVAGVSITESAGSTEVTEDGTTDSYTVVLTTQPTADVTITLSPDVETDLGGGAGTPIDLIFTDSDWDSAQTVMVTAVDDAVAEGNHGSTISHSAASSDGNYDGITIVNVTATIADNDTAGFSITETDGHTAIGEDGTTDTIEVVLTSEPAQPVTVTFTMDGQVQLSTTSLVFHALNWNDPQTVTVTAVDDDDVESYHTSIVTFAISSSDANYSNLADKDISINITDNDIAYIFMPMVVNNFTTAPDLVVNEITVTGNSVQVTIENQGTAPVTEEFWIDLLINPNVPPTQVNHTWQTQGGEGTHWGLEADALPLDPGDTLVLTLGDARDFGGNFSGVIPAGATIYAHVDSANTDTTYGAVNEIHEQIGAAYNNIASVTTSSTIVLFVNDSGDTTLQPQSVFLPTR